jgi:hypothetical protein
MTHITTEEATRLGLPLSDSFRYSHLLYKTDFYRDFGAVQLNTEALKAFHDTVAIAQRDALATEDAAFEKWMRAGGPQNGSPCPWGPASQSRLTFRNFEYLKIACGFELHLKARLLARDYLVHLVDSKASGCGPLAAAQSNRPIAKAEFLALQSFHFDGTQNYLPGLLDGSINFSWLTERPAYKAALGLTDQQLDLISSYRKLRNAIHFPGEVRGLPTLHLVERATKDLLIDFINSEIVEWTNGVATTRKFKHTPMQSLGKSAG